MKYQIYSITEEQKIEIERARKENKNKCVEKRLRVLWREIGYYLSLIS